MNALSSKQAFNLRWFLNGHHIDVCIDICNQIGGLLPSESFGQTIKKSHIQALFVRGFLVKEFTESFGICYWRFSVSESGKNYLEEYGNDCSK